MSCGRRARDGARTALGGGASRVASVRAARLALVAGPGRAAGAMLAQRLPRGSALR